MMTALVCGSYAYDTLMVFQDEFGKHILPDKTHQLNVSFYVPQMRREFGGCAGNISYNLFAMGGDVLPMGTVGDDFAPYRRWIKSTGINDSLVTEADDTYTAQCFITTDLKNNQITAFHPGAMDAAHTQTVPTDRGVSIGIVSPDGRDAMIQHAEQFAAAGIPFIFDPGQGLPMFAGDEILKFIEQATWVAANDYEAAMICERTGLTEAQVAEKVEAFIITRGGEGSQILTGGQVIDIPCVKATDVVDPTGCGDAYRAGLLYGLMNKLDWETTGRIASLLGSIKIANAGTQNHELANWRDLFAVEFGSTVA
jgi:adenosine kinase